MGEDKGLALLAGQPLVSYVARVLESVTDEIVIAVAAGESEGYRKVLGKEYRIVEDRRSDVGPLQGLTTALGAARGEYVLVSPCDTPFLRAEFCRSIVLLSKKRDGAVPRFGDSFEPLHGVYRRLKCLAAFEEALEEGRRKPVDAYSALDIEYVPEEVVRVMDPRLESFWNLNTPEDLMEAELKLRNVSR
jgi:molybdopterin-guanine dinucleotide biosynthesis protein A